MNSFWQREKGIDEGGFSDVGATKNGEFRSVVFWAIPGAGAALYELDVLDVGIAGVGSDGDVGAGKDRGVIDLVGFNPWRDE